MLLAFYWTTLTLPIAGLCTTSESGFSKAEECPIISANQNVLEGVDTWAGQFDCSERHSRCRRPVVRALLLFMEVIGSIFVRCVFLIFIHFYPFFIFKSALALLLLLLGWGLVWGYRLFTFSLFPKIEKGPVFCSNLNALISNKESISQWLWNNNEVYWTHWAGCERYWMIVLHCQTQVCSVSPNGEILEVSTQAAYQLLHSASFMKRRRNWETIKRTHEVHHPDLFIW